MVKTHNSPNTAALRHDLLTPVNQIFGYSELVAEQLGDLLATTPNAEADDKLFSTLRTDLGRIRAAGQQLLTIIESHLPSTVTRVDTPTVALPTVPSGPAVATPSSEPAEGPVGALLVVDDNAENRELLARHLERQGHRVATARSGSEALALLRERAFDVMLLDLVMPDLDGFAVLQRVRADESLRGMPVIMISALSELDSVVRCIELGAEDYLPKPTSPVLLRARIGACLEKKRLRDREQRLYEELSANYQRLRELERLRDDLASMLIHDLRTPLSALMTGLQALPLLGHLDPPQEQLLRLSLRGGQTLLGMINDLLEISRLEEGAQPLERRSLKGAEIVEMIEQSILQVQPLLQDKGLTIQRDVPADLASMAQEIWADDAMLGRVLVNLLGNAVKFTPAPGVITVSARSDGGYLVLSVRDTGPGIPPQDFEHIFNKFGVVVARREGRMPSTGLGLTFCRMVVESYQGKIWVNSELGKGSTFSFSIPLAAPSSSANSTRN